MCSSILNAFFKESWMINKKWNKEKRNQKSPWGKGVLGSWMGLRINYLGECLQLTWFPIIQSDSPNLSKCYIVSYIYIFQNIYCQKNGMFYLKLNNSNLCTCSQSVGDNRQCCYLSCIFSILNRLFVQASFLKCSMLLLKKKGCTNKSGNQFISVLWNITFQNSCQSFGLSILFNLYK